MNRQTASKTGPVALSLVRISVALMIPRRVALLRRIREGFAVTNQSGLRLKFCSDLSIRHRYAKRFDGFRMLR